MTPAYRLDSNASETSRSALTAEFRQQTLCLSVREQLLHPDGIDDLDAWLTEWPVWPDCVALADTTGCTISEEFGAAEYLYERTAGSNRKLGVPDNAGFPL